ncbi:MAG: protein-glutamate O-methyltransferase CheR [Woeseiaceae bacterium]
MIMTNERNNTQSGMPTSISDAELDQFQQLAFSATGIELSGSKRSMIYSRFTRRLRTLNLNSFSAYLKIAANRDGEEFEHFVNTITTNLTYFFREPHHFDFLKDTVIPKAAAARKGEALRIWSAGCSSGEEPYSIAMVLAESEKRGETDYRLLCTDIDTQMVTRTERGIYKDSQTRGLDSSRRSQWFTKEGDGEIAVIPELKRGMICKKLNLFDTTPVRPGVDIIFCRNVLIYFDKEHQRKVVKAFSNVQRSGQFLFLGHSESLRGFDNIYKRVSNTVYERV